MQPVDYVLILHNLGPLNLGALGPGPHVAPSLIRHCMVLVSNNVAYVRWQLGLLGFIIPVQITAVRQYYMP